MITSKIIGGLGNQMFQYAAAKALAMRLGCSVGLDVTAFNGYKLHNGFELEKFSLYRDIAKISESRSTDALSIRGQSNVFQGKIIKFLVRKINSLKLSHYIESGFSFDEGLFKQKAPITIEGYWQSYKYFDGIRGQILNDFNLITPPSGLNEEIASEISKNNSVSIHVRRGDYVANAHTNSYHGTCDLEYYQNAIREIEGVVAEPVYFIFSDDLDWVRQNLKISKKAIFVGHNKGNDSHFDMHLMSLCKHNIIANSSFSWWGAWLNKNPSKLVIAPRRWFAINQDSADLVPSAWVRI